MWVRAIGAAVFWVSVNSIAQAQAEQNPLVQAAAAEYEAGTEDFEDDDYEAALVHFRRAFEIQPYDAIRFNIGVCLERLGRFRDASEEFELAAESEELDDETRARAARFLARVLERLGTVEIRGSVDGAQVLIDGTPACVLPCTTRLDPGEHRLEVRADDGGRGVRVIELDRGEELAVWIDIEGASTSESSEGALGVLGWVGIGVAAAGAAAAIGFGIRTIALHDEFEAMPSQDLRTEGLTFQGLTWTGIGVAVLGLGLFVLDLAL